MASFTEGLCSREQLRRRLIIVAFDCTKIPAAEQSFGARNHDVVTTRNVNNIGANVDDCDAFSCSHSRGGVRRRLLLRFRCALVAVAQAPRAISDLCTVCGAISRKIVEAGTAGQCVRPHASRVLALRGQVPTGVTQRLGELGWRATCNRSSCLRPMRQPGWLRAGAGPIPAPAPRIARELSRHE